MKKNINRFPRIRGRIFENEDTNVDEHIADSKFLINADACGCSAKDIKDTLENDGLSVSVSGKWITVRTTSEIDAKEAAKAIKKICKGKYGSFVINDEESHNKAAHSEFIKVEESEEFEEFEDYKQFHKPTNKKINVKEDMTLNAQKKICEGLINYFKQSNIVNESENDIVNKIKANKTAVHKFIDLYKLMTTDSALLESLESLKRWVDNSSINEGTAPSMRNHFNRKQDNNVDNMINEAVSIIYDDFSKYMKDTKNVSLRNVYGTENIKNEMQQYRDVFEGYKSSDKYNFMSNDLKYGHYIKMATNYLYEGITNEMKEHFGKRINEAKKEKTIQVNESNNEKVNVINKVEGYFIGRGKINGLANKSLLLNATINEGIRPLIESEKDAKQKQLLESFETWALMNGKSLINESELINLDTTSSVDASTRKQLFENAIDGMINKSVKKRRTSNVDRIKKYLKK